MPVGRAESAKRATAAGSATPIRPALLAVTIGFTCRFAVAAQAILVTRALAAGPTAAVGPTLLAVTIGLALVLQALAAMTFVAWPARTASTPATIGTAVLHYAIRHASAAGILTLAFLAALTLRAGAATAAAAVSPADPAHAIRNAGTARTTVLRLNQVHTSFVPLGVAAVRTLAADTILNRVVVTSRCVMLLAAVAGTWALTAVLSTLLTTLAAFALAVAAHRAFAPAGTAAHSIHFVYTNSIPFFLTAIGILFANTVLHRGIVAPGGSMGLAAAGPLAFAAIFRAGEAILIVITGPVPAAATIAVPTIELGHFVHANLVPGVPAAERVFLTNASLNRRVFAAGTFLRLTAITRASTRPAVFGAGLARLAYCA